MQQALSRYYGNATGCTDHVTKENLICHIMFGFDRYDPKTDTWTQVASMSEGRDDIGVWLLGVRLIAVGGYNGHYYLKLVEAYDTQNNEWQQVSNS
jgi:hypothetical protein